MKPPIYILYFAILIALQSCGVFMIPPGGVEDRSYIGESTPTQRDFEKLPQPKEQVVVGVYKFRDQTGQYKASEMGANWSTAVPQGLTTILIKSLEDSKWFVPIERENIGNLLNERQIIRTTRQEYAGNNQTNNQLPPLLFAGILLEGGVISYDTNILTGGAGARYFGIGGSTEYRQDRITVYLRAVSTSNGKVLKTVYTSKTILSQSINSSMFRYIDFERLMEAEVGVTNNEPVHIAVTEAINKAVYLMVLEGIKDKVWETADEEVEIANELLVNYNKEMEESNKRVVGKGIWEKERRSKFSFGLSYTFNTLKGDYKTQTMRPGVKGTFKYVFSDYFNVNLSIGLQELGSKQYFRSTFSTYDLDLEYITMPFNQFSPYLFGGFGIITDTKGLDRDGKFKTQFGGGLEYLISPTVGIRGFGSYHIGFDDNWDEKISGKRDDHFLQVGVGVQINFGERKK
ncbi:CsgG/HfaB family protein [Moheibacter sp.]|uniref:CsgG/HfaB family protein n=1 Tax=Moheibacter sp. TaxID=1965316 RepID=UPI003C794070